jgi:hypothetical protein
MEFVIDLPIFAWPMLDLNRYSEFVEIPPPDAITCFATFRVSVAFGAAEAS